MKKRHVKNWVTIFMLTALFCVATNGYASGNDYYGYLDEGEGTFSIFKLNLAERHVFMITSDMGPLGEFSEIIGFSAKETLSQEDLNLLRSAFNTLRSTKFNIVRSLKEDSKLFFITDSEKIKDSDEIRVVFAGIDTRNKISGHITIDYWDDEDFLFFQKMKRKMVFYNVPTGQTNTLHLKKAWESSPALKYSASPLPTDSKYVYTGGRGIYGYSRETGNREFE